MHLPTTSLFVVSAFLVVISGCNYFESASTTQDTRDRSQEPIELPPQISDASVDELKPAAAQGITNIANELWTVERVFEGVAQQFSDDDSFTAHYYADCTANEGGEKITVHLACVINDFASPKELQLRERDVIRIVSDDFRETKKAMKLYDGTFVSIVHRTNQDPKVGQEAIEY